MNLPKFSVITTSFNQGQYIAQNIESVLQQDYANFEHIIIDGGSKDSTVDVLKSYGHLKWVSEPDEGQTDALNKGFKRASGDIIAWINSDDWYAPKIFHEVAQALNESPVVMGACLLIDKDGNPMYQVDNLERSWFDMLKYWVPYSIPCQPAIFFRRELLQEFIRPDGTHLDKELYYVMDYDLWMRVARKYPFARRIAKVLAYYRMTESNKTSHDIPGMAYAEPEMSRIFNRSANSLVQTEKKISFVLPASELNQEFKNTLGCALAQRVLDYEVIIVNYSPGSSSAGESRTALRTMAREINTERNRRGLDCYVRFLDAPSPSFTSALAAGLDASSGAISVCVEPGTAFSENLACEVTGIFSSDRMALAFARSVCGDDAPAYGHFSRSQLPNGNFSVEGMLASPPLPWNCALRTVAWRDANPVRRDYSASLMLRELMIRLLFSGWQVKYAAEVNFTFDKLAADVIEAHELFSTYANAQIISSISADIVRQPFARIRISTGFTQPFHPALIEHSRRLLSYTPPDWQRGEFRSPLEDLKRCALQYSKFSPALRCLLRECGKIGDRAGALEAQAKLKEALKAEELY